MLQLPRALIVNAQPMIANGIACSLRERSREIAIRIESSLEGANRALEDYRPHIVFLSWGLGSSNRSASTLLRKLADLMESEPDSYEYPLMVNMDWDAEFEKDWEELGITFHFDNPRIMINKANWQIKGPEVIDRFLKKVEPKRLLTLTRAKVPLSKCAYLRISDSPLQLHYWGPHSKEEVSLPRHRCDTFDQIAKQLMMPDQVQGEQGASLPSLFVSANKRNSWVNLAHVKKISFNNNAERCFVFGDVLEQEFRLSESMAVSVTNYLERLKQMNYWEYLSDISVPG